MQAIGFDGYNGALTGDKSSTLGVNCGMTTGRCGVLVPKVIGFDSYNLMVTDDNAKTITNGCNNEHIPVVFVLNDQGGAYIDVTEDRVNTLRAQEHGHQPCILVKK